MLPHSQPAIVVDNIAGDKLSTSSSSFPASLEDFFNMDMLGASSAANPALVSGGASSSRASSHSPSDSFAQLPPTPPQQEFSSFDSSASMGFGGFSAMDEDSLFNFRYDDGVDYLKNNPMAALSSSAPFDFLGGFLGGSVGDSISSGSNSGASPTASGTSATQTPFSGFSIDPHLMGTPGPSSAASVMGDEEEEGEDDDEAEEDLSFLAPLKVGGKGKGRKGTVQSGGIVKKSGINEKKDSKHGKDDSGELQDSVPDDWRPSPEEYQKMSSKEKRQLRNKISARNFRVRRKEYIQTLEGDIAERDKLIDAIRGELGSTKSENNALRQEVTALKKAILEGRASPMLPPPAPLSPLSPVATISPLATSISANTQGSSSSNKFLKVNTAKDLPTSPRLSAAGSAFWGGQAGGFGTFGGITPVHSAIIPEYGFGMSSFVGKPASSSDSIRANENMNPALNHVSVPIAVAASKVFASSNSANAARRSSSPVLSTMPAPATSNTLGSDASNESINLYNQNLLMTQLLGQAPHGFDAFSDINPFTLKTLDSYRMQLWGRVAAQQGAQRYAAPNMYTGHSSANTSPASSPSPNGSPNPGLHGLASNLRPHYFTTPTSSRSSLSSLLSGKTTVPSSSHVSYPTPPASPKPSQRKVQTQTQTPAQQMQMQQAMLASLASQTLLQKMGHAFWDAFSGQSSSSSPKSWDAEKVRKVLDGSAVLKVVDVEPQAKAKAPVTSAEVALEESLHRMSLGGGSSSKEKDPLCFLSRAAKSKVSCAKTA